MIEFFSFALGITSALVITFIFILYQGHKDTEVYNAVELDIDHGTGLPYEKPELDDLESTRRASAES